MQDADLPNYLPGYLVYEGVKQEAPKFEQGSDISLTVDLMVNGQPVNYEDYVLRAVLKADLDRGNVTWQGFDNYGIFKVGCKAQIRIPPPIAVGLLAGIYHIAVVGVEKANPNHRAVLWKGIISINLNAGSPLPTYPVIVYLTDDAWLTNLGIYVPIDHFSI